ncbi:GNAT family N-acetyltransferase [Cohnella lubricantis]|uniref:GNAT family N-acetyltransferase n=1 Tax=Cohnella lubricantis TaxID=2163172 RepID=A0A841TDK3_9BACL|nr:GNAT family N-acetyltransferase [Cohnella lubricantis]MBB6679112.1 GNAT family N-acetyltransferase [Cohnella lubricantis]MBP2119646.1 ribosomal protein S18 acetylase RimI-like enzyme [Cohnella lubricantis]
MITYSACTDVTMRQIYDAFQSGFADYPVQFNMDMDTFAARFFGPEGNELDRSFIALGPDGPVGLILGGVRRFDGLKTMRCGTLCIAPDYRGLGVSQRLFELHKQAARDAGCDQLFLEVLKENNRAIRFYEKQGYQIQETLEYYNGLTASLPTEEPLHSYAVEEISHNELAAFRDSLPNSHINWQSDPPFYAASDREALLAVYSEDRQTIAMVAMSASGKTNFLWVDPAQRGQGLGRWMLQQAAAKHQAEKLNVCLPVSAALDGYFRKLGFEKQPVEQYEMNMPLQ